MAGKNGGYRPGSGRKPRQVKHAGAINAAERKIKDRLPELIDALMALALGHKSTTGDDTVYTVSPDRVAAQYLVNRIMGSPVQKQEIDGEISTIRIVYDDVDQPEETDEAS